MKHTFRNPDKFQVLPFRDWIRAKKPSGKAGYVVEDLDLVLRVFGERYKTDADGRFMLIELKFGNAYIGIAQKRTFGLIHRLLRIADPKKHRYFGYFVVQYDNENWDLAEFKINKHQISQSDFYNFLDLDFRNLGNIPDFPS